MSVASDRIYILGAGSVGMSLAVHLANSGRLVTAVRTSADDIDPQATEVTVTGPEGRTFKSSVATVSLARLKRLAGVVVVTAKSYANHAIAARLKEMEILAPVVIMQNGVAVEDPYLALDALSIYRCILYVTGQKNGPHSYTFMPVTASLVGVVRGATEELDRLVRLLNTAEFPFIAHADIREEVWKKAAINAVFNSICTLLDVDNGIFVRDARAALLAREVVDECITVMQAMGFRVSAEAVMQQIFAVSRRSDGQLISTLQDINDGRDTEIDHLNLAIARIAGTVAPGAKISTTRVLGEMVRIKSTLRKKP